MPLETGSVENSDSQSPVAPLFEFTSSEPHLLESFRRYRRSRALARYTTLLKVFLGICLIGLIAICILAGAYMGVLVISVFLAFLLFAHRIDEFLIARRFRKSPYRDEHIRIQLSAAGFVATGTTGSCQLSWAAFTEALRFDDGFLLFQGPGVFNWLPSRAITQGTIAEAEDLIRTNVPQYKPA